MDGRAIFANMAARFDGAPHRRTRGCSIGRKPRADHGEIFDGSTVDTGPLSALDELRQYRQWVAWRYLLRPGATTPTKPPNSAITGSGASHSNPAHWSSYEEAEAFAKRRNIPGVGFALSEDDDYTGIDLDKCRDPATGKLDQWAEDIVALNETYWEVSPSCTGLRAFVRGKVPKTVKCDTAHVEIYRSLRYLTFTDDHIDRHASRHPPGPDDARMAYGARRAVRAEGGCAHARAPIIKREQLIDSEIDHVRAPPPSHISAR